MKMRPLGDRVIVEVVEAEETTKGGLILPDTAKERPQEAVVKAIGTGRRLDSGKRAAMSVKKGDLVMFARYSGTEVNLDGTEYLILREADILATCSK